jgi:hypothetical protein
MVNIGVRVDMQDAQFGMTPTHCAHDRMSDRMIATETNQRIACLQGACHMLLDEVPRITGAVKLNVTMILKPAGDAQFDA